jgi:hypothetical protein
MTTIKDAIGYHGPGNNTDIRRIPAIKRLFPRCYGAILMTCTKKQVRLLYLLWQDRFPCTDRLNSVLKELVDQGNMPVLLDRKSKQAEFLIESRYSLSPCA